MRNFFIYILVFIVFFTTCNTGVARTFEAGNGSFMLDGEPYVIKAAELHYPRIPRPYWEHRIQMCKALGMNTICLYVFWNVHEYTEGVFDFEGQHDLRHFIELCAANEMYVILRPGPYVCAEWEMGGLPWWLLKKEGIRLRENDPYFLERVELFQSAVAGQTADLTIDKGGPILMVQVENEYGAYGTDKEYVAAIRDMLRRQFGSKVMLFQCDWSSNFTNNGLDDLLWTMNFGTGADIDEQFSPLRHLRPQSPLMCSEFWSGWFDKWGANHETRPADAMTAGIDSMLAHGISFSLYMAHGGTNWGHWAGANSPGYAPDVTSYDYDAPINEQGAVTPKYHLLRSTMAKYAAGELPAIPQAIPTDTIAKFHMQEYAPLCLNLPTPKADDDIHPMEHYGQGYGSIIYSTVLPALNQTNNLTGATLTIDKPADYAQIFLGDSLIGIIDRRLGQHHVTLPTANTGDTLTMIVEAMGRINFGRAITDRKGITNGVSIAKEINDTLHTADLKGWTIYNIADELATYTNMNFKPISEASAKNGRLPRGTYRGTFTIERPADTFLDFSTWGKGLVYVNGHALGRIWSIGPQQTLYIPGCWLQQGQNEIIVFDIIGPSQATVRGLAEPILDKLQTFDNSNDTHPTQAFEPDFGAITPTLEDSFDAIAGWQTRTFSVPVTGRYLCFQADSATDGSDYVAVAEFYALDADGKQIPRENWTILNCTSQETDGNHTADKMIDLQESTYWSTANSGQPATTTDDTDTLHRLPHRVVIDLGEQHTVTAIQYLPRTEPGIPGAVDRFKIYLY